MKKRQNLGYREYFDGCQMGGGVLRLGEEVRGLTNRQLQNSYGDVKYEVGNGVAKVPIRHDTWT